MNNVSQKEVDLNSLYVTAKKYDEAAEKLGYYFLVQHHVFPVT